MKISLKLALLCVASIQAAKTDDAVPVQASSDRLNRRSQNSRWMKILGMFSHPQAACQLMEAYFQDDYINRAKAFIERYQTTFQFFGQSVESAKRAVEACESSGGPATTPQPTTLASTPGGNTAFRDCGAELQYDTTTFAQSIEEAIQNFPDLSREGDSFTRNEETDMVGPDEDAQPRTAGFSRSGQSNELRCEGRRCNRDCQSILLSRLITGNALTRAEGNEIRKKLGRTRGSLKRCPTAKEWKTRGESTFRIGKNREEAEKAFANRPSITNMNSPLATSLISPETNSSSSSRRPSRTRGRGKSARTCPSLNLAGAERTWDTIVAAETLGSLKRQNMDASSPSLTARQVLMSDSASLESREYPGRVTVLSCHRRGEADSANQDSWVIPCNVCWVLRTLDSRYVTPHVNELVCGSESAASDDSKCLSGFGKCHQRSKQHRVPVRDPSTGRLSYEYIRVRTCCDCKVLNGSPLHRFYAK